MRVYFDAHDWDARVERLKAYVSETSSHPGEMFLNLGGLKTVRVLAYDRTALLLIDREMSFARTGPVPFPDATIVLWKEPEIFHFMCEVFNLSFSVPFEEDFVEFSTTAKYKTTLKTISGEDPYAAVVSTGQVNIKNKTIHIAATDNMYFYGVESFEPEDWIKEGHVLVQMLFHVFDSEPSKCLAHGACIGLEGKGVLLCARGNLGKSTLSVTAMIKGFDIVSEDYLILDKRDNGLFASPLYSIITLSPWAYNSLYDNLKMAQFVGISSWKGKYIFNIDAFSDHLRWRYPVSVCMFPEINPNAKEPMVCECDRVERGKVLTHFAHSTRFQMWSRGLYRLQKESDLMLKLVGMIKDMDFYKIVLTPDLFANVECLRQFLITYNK